jgi:hypothetical protein
MQVGILRADAERGFAQAVEKLAPPAIGVRGARTLLGELVTADAGRHTKADRNEARLINGRWQEGIRMVMFRLLRTQVRIGLRWFPRESRYRAQLPWAATVA